MANAVCSYLLHFRQSGKFSIAFMKTAGEKEYYIACACQKIYAPPSASISLRGFAVGGESRQDGMGNNQICTAERLYSGR